MQKLALIALLVAAACGGKQDGGDAGITPDGGGGDVAVCTYQETRTSSDRTCSVSTDCVVVVRSLTCCQEQDEGIRKDAAQKFQSDQAALTAACPGCGCAAQGVDELGNKGATFIASCDNGACTAHAQ